MKINIRRPISYDPVKNESYEEIHFDLFVNQGKEYVNALELFENVVTGLKQLLAEFVRTGIEPRHRFSCMKKLGKSNRPLPMPAPPVVDPKVAADLEIERKAKAIEAEIAKGQKEESKRVEQRKKEADARKAAKDAAKAAKADKK